jgi:hypothetical protein
MMTPLFTESTRLRDAAHANAQHDPVCRTLLFWKSLDALDNGSPRSTVVVLVASAELTTTDGKKIPRAADGDPVAAVRNLGLEAAALAIRRPHV